MERWIKVVGQGCFASGLLLLSGCAFLKPPEKAELPVAVTSARAPRRATDIFDPTEGVTHWTTTTLNDPKDPKKPDKFEVTRVDSGEFIWIRSVKNTTIAVAAKPAPAAKPGAKGKATAPAPAPTPVTMKIYGVPEEVHVAGIVTPQPGQPGWADTVNKVKEWTMNAQPGTNVIPEVDVEEDPIFPQDLSTPHLRLVQVWFQGTSGKVKGQMLNLARMLVHTGYAVADFNSPTSLDVKPWYNDEQFARTYIDDKTNKLAPLGLWGKNIILAQRLAPPVPPGTKAVIQTVSQVHLHGKGSAQAARGDHITVTKTKRTTTTTTATQTTGSGYPSGSRMSGAASAPGKMTSTTTSTSSTTSAGNKPSP